MTQQNEQFMQRLNDFIAAATKASADYWERNKYTFAPAPTFEYEFGPKWVKVYKVEGPEENRKRASIYAFIVVETNQTKTLGFMEAGDIMKPASYKLPAKHRRGSLFHPTFNDCIGPISIAYLR